MLDLLIRYIHLLAVLVLIIALLIENLAISSALSKEDTDNLARVDLVYLSSLLLAALAGIALWLWVGKPAQFYNGNPVFHAKLGLFTMLILLAAYPHLFLRKSRRALQFPVHVPAAVIWLLRIQLVVIAVIPISAWMLARGIGN